MVTNGVISRAKLQSNRRHQQTNTQLFTGRILHQRWANCVSQATHGLQDLFVWPMDILANDRLQLLELIKSLRSCSCSVTFMKPT